MAPDDTAHDDVLPGEIYTYGQAATVARDLADFFDRTDGDSSSLSRLAGELASVCEVIDQDQDDDNRRYGARVTFVDGDGDAHCGLIVEPDITHAGGEAWDPRRGEMVDPREAYPHGTVQLVHGPALGPGDGFVDRSSDLDVATSVSPATGPDDTYCYYPGWEHAEAEA